MTETCKRCKKGLVNVKDFGFLLRYICHVCGDFRDEPKPGREAEFHEWQYETANRIDELEK